MTDTQTNPNVQTSIEKGELPPTVDLSALSDGEIQLLVQKRNQELGPAAGGNPTSTIRQPQFQAAIDGATGRQTPGEMSEEELSDLERRATEAEAVLSQSSVNAATTVGDVTIDMSNLTLEDLVTLESAANKQLSTPELISFLDKIVVGGAKKIKITQLPAITRALIEQTRKMSNPGN